jgi:hypothetical protein
VGGVVRALLVCLAADRGEDEDGERVDEGERRAANHHGPVHDQNNTVAKLATWLNPTRA